MAWKRWLAASMTAGVALATFGSGCGRSNDIRGGEFGGFPNVGGAGGIDTVNFEPCAEVAEEASLVPVELFLLVDKSGSMDDTPMGADNSKWVDTESAFSAFFQDTSVDGLRVALRFWPDDTCTDDDPDDQNDNDPNCDVSGCAVPAVDADLLNDAVHQQALIDAFAATMPGGPTPMSSALTGGVTWAEDQIANATGPVAPVIVLVTDGEPNGCLENLDDITAIAAAAFQSDGIRTYVVGLAGSNEATVNAIAAAGGTNEAFFIGSGNTQAELTGALLDIAGQTVNCSFPVPDPEPGETFDPRLVRIEYTPGGATAPLLIPRVKDATECDATTGGFYYDDNTTPTTVTLCDESCNVVEGDAEARVKLAIGCECEIDLDCPGDLVCIANACVDPCRTDADCPGELICREGRCVEPPGRPCTSDPECPGAQVCLRGECTYEGLVVGNLEAVQGGAFSCQIAPPVSPRNVGWWSALAATGLLIRRRRRRS